MRNRHVFPRTFDRDAERVARELEVLRDFDPWEATTTSGGVLAPQWSTVRTRLGRLLLSLGLL